MKILSIGATDSSTGAGLLADLKVAARLGVQCEAVVIAITAQNHQGALAAHLLELAWIQQQYQAVIADGEPAVIRLGWLPMQQEYLAWLVDCLEHVQATVLWDPVLAASQGSALNQAWQAVDLKPTLQRLLKRVDMITPNAQEAVSLAQHFGQSCSTPEDAGRTLQRLSRAHVLVTGIEAHSLVRDFFVHNPMSRLEQSSLPGPSLAQEFYLTQTALTLSRHGTGCHFIAQLACRMIQGQPLYDALVQANVATRLFLQRSERMVAEAPAEYWPLVHTLTVSPQTEFARLAQPLGLYGLVDNLEHLQRLLSLGIDCLQWRVKKLTASYYADTQQAIALCRKAKVPLFINDDWRLALELGAFGVHLGQEDLACADLDAIQAAGLRLGISTHSDWEVARARALKPSYIALGPVFKPLSKELKYVPLGVQRLRQYVRRYPQQSFTCIGGITQTNCQAVWNTGVQSLAVVTELANDDDLPERFYALKCQNPAP